MNSPPVVDRCSVTFHVPDPGGDLSSVRLYQEVARPRLGPSFERRAGGWELQWPRPAADRMEYMLELTHRQGAIELIPDPANPLRAPGPFGIKSVIEFPGYRPPAWVTSEPASPGTIMETSVPSTVLDAPLTTVLWTPAGHRTNEPLPLLVVHDGPQYDEFAALLRFLEKAVSAGQTPPLRAALIAPIERNHTYSASAAYARALALEVLPQVGTLAPTPSGSHMRVGMGASLGALAMFHAHRSYPGTFGALFLQSGSFFRPHLDPQESTFARWGRITRFMYRVSCDTHWTHPVPVTMTCGTAEENLANNQATRDALRAQGYEVTWHEQRDAHNWISWRDALHPHLTHLLRELWA